MPEQQTPWSEERAWIECGRSTPCWRRVGQADDTTQAPCVAITSPPPLGPPASGVAQTESVRGMSLRALDKSLTRPSFFLYFREIRKKLSHPCGQSAQRLYNRYNLCPCARPAHVGECGPGPEFKFSKTVQVRESC